MSATITEPRRIHSTCYMCTVNCPITLETEGDAVRIAQMPDCVRGAAMLEQRDNPSRLLQACVRATAAEAWRRVSWPAAVEHAASKLQEIRRRHGPQSVAFAVGYTKEVRPYLQRLAYAFGSPHYITESSCCFSSGFIAAKLTLGKEYAYYLSPSRANQPETRCRLLWSTNPEASQLPYGRHFTLLEDAQSQLIVVDPRRTSAAEKAAVHLQLRPGTDGALALGLAHVIFAEGLEDKAFLVRHAHGLDAYRAYLKEFTPETTEAITGIARDTIIRAARLYATAKPSQIMISPNSTTHHSNGFQAHRAILLLSAVTGNLDVPGGNRPWTARAMEKSITFYDERYPALAARHSPMGAARFPQFIAHYPEAQGMVLADAIESGQIKAVFSVGLNVMMWPNSSRLDRLLRGLEFFSVSDFHPSPTSDAATAIFPAATHLEREALVVAGNGQVRRRPMAVAPRGDARGDMELVFAMAEQLGLNADFWNGDRHASFDERLQPLGLRWADLPEDGSAVNVALPAPPVRSYMEQGFGTPTGKVEFVSTTLEQAGIEALPVYHEPYWSPVSRPDLAKDYPLILTSGGRSNNYTHSQGRHFESLRRREPHPRAQMHPVDAAARGIAEGDRVEVTSPLGKIYPRAELSDTLPRGVVHCFHGWAEANVNVLIPDGDALDPVTGFPPFKSSLCQVKKA